MVVEEQRLEVPHFEPDFYTVASKPHQEKLVRGQIKLMQIRETVKLLEDPPFIGLLR
jgi:hypothetical protein